VHSLKTGGPPRCCNTADDPRPHQEDWRSHVHHHHPAHPGSPRLDAAARHRADRLAKATTDQIQAALAYLSMIDPEAFEIALTAAAPAPADDPEDDEPIPLCRACGAPVGIFPELTLSWRH
jgi:hypothetical protein